MARLPSVTVEQRAPWLHVVKTSLAIAIAWGVSVLVLGEPIPVFAAIAALLVVAPSVNQSIGKGIERSLGVILGVALAWLAGLVLGTDSLTVLLLVIIAVVVSWLIRLAPMASNQVPISAMLMLALGVTGDPQLALDRIVETIIGAVVAFVVNIAIVPPVSHTPAELALRDLAERIAGTFDEIAEALEAEQFDRDGLLERARALRSGTASTRTAMDDLRDTLMLNPRARRMRERIARDEELLGILTILTNRVIGMARTVAEDHGGPMRDDPVVPQLSAEIRRISHDVRLLVQTHEAEDVATSTLPVPVQALTEPISLPSPDPLRWVTIGALLEDVRQVRESLSTGFASA